MVRIALVIFSVLAVGLVDIPPLLNSARRTLVTVCVLLIISLVSGLMIVTPPEGASVAKVIIQLIAPLGEALLGPM
jgi:hypothetical protein